MIVLYQKEQLWGIVLENVLWFANNKEDAHEEPTIKDQDHDYVSKEVQNVRKM